jgi:hypothetical protein
MRTILLVLGICIFLLNRSNAQLIISNENGQKINCSGTIVFQIPTINISESDLRCSKVEISNPVTNLNIANTTITCDEFEIGTGLGNIQSSGTVALRFITKR